MKKILNYILIVIFVIGCVFVCGNQATIKTGAKEFQSSSDLKGPRCSLNLPNKVKIGKTVYGYVQCYDSDGLADTNISVSDFRINNGLIKKIKITNISGAQTSDNITYTWQFKIKGTFFGNASVSLNPSVIFDNTGKGNYVTVTENVKVSLI